MKKTDLIVTDAQNIRVGDSTMNNLTQQFGRQLVQAIKSDDSLKDGFRLTWDVTPLDGIVIEGGK